MFEPSEIFLIWSQKFLNALKQISRPKINRPIDRYMNEGVTLMTEFTRLSNPVIDA